MGDPAPGKLEADRAGWFVRDYFPDGVCPVSSIAFDSEGGAIGIDLSSGAFTTSGIKIGEAAIGIDFSSVSVTGHAIHMVDAFPVQVIETGTYGSAASKGVTLSDTNTRPVSFLFDDANAALTGNNRAVMSRVYLAHAQAAGATIVAIQGQLKIADNKNLGAGRWSAMDAYLEFGGTTTLTTGGYTSALDVRVDIPATETVTVNSGAVLAGIHVQTTGTGTLANSGALNAIYINDQGTVEDWDVGVDINNCTTGIDVGACTTGLAVTGVASSYAINISAAAGAIGIYMPSQTKPLLQGVSTISMTGNTRVVSIDAISATNASFQLSGIYAIAYPSSTAQANSKFYAAEFVTQGTLNTNYLRTIYSYLNFSDAKTHANGCTCLHADVNVAAAITVSTGPVTGIWSQYRGAGAVTTAETSCVFADIDEDIDKAITVDVASAKTCTTGLDLGGTGAYTTGISIGGGALTTGIAIDAGTVNHTADGAIIDINLDIQGAYSVNAINVNLDFETTGMGAADVTTAFNADINELVAHTDAAGLYGTHVTLTGFATGECDLIGHLVTLDGTKTTDETVTGFKTISTSVINHSGAALYGNWIDFSGITHTDGGIYGQYINLAYTNTAADCWGTFYLMGNYGTAIAIDAGTTAIDTAADLIYVDLGVNSCSVNVINAHIDVDTALTTGENVRGLSIDINGDNSDHGDSTMSGVYLTSANTTTGVNKGIEIAGTWDTGIDIATTTTAISIGTATKGIHLGSSGGDASGSGLLMGIGTAGTPATDATVSGKFIELRCATTATSGDCRLQYMRYYMNGINGTGGECLKAGTVLGAAIGTARGEQASIEVSSTGYVTGFACGMDALLEVTNTALPASGTYCAAQSQIYITGSSSDISAVAHGIHRFSVIGGDATAEAKVLNAFNFDVVNCVGNGLMIEEGTNTGTMIGSIRITMNGTARYMHFYDAPG